MGGCMLRWVEQCRAGLSGATCPICRGQIQFHAQRLEQFLSGAQSAGLATEDRTFLQQCADRLRATGDADWGDVFTLENAQHVGGIGAWLLAAATMPTSEPHIGRTPTAAPHSTRSWLGGWLDCATRAGTPTRKAWA